MDGLPIRRLPDDLLMMIVDYIHPDQEKTVKVYARSFLSVESLEIPPASNAYSDLCRFRQTCRWFAAIGEPALFSVIGIRFSDKGLDKLEELISWGPKIRRHVKKFSYLMPYYYPQAERIIAAGQPDWISQYTFNRFKERLDEQNRIRDTGKDVRVLARALQSFTALQVVKLLRVADRTDEDFKKYVAFREGLENWVERYWAPSCTLGSRAIGRALILTNIELARFYIPALNTRTLQDLNPFPPPSLSILAARLTCLTLVFDDGHDLDERIQELSPLFKEVFTAAENMQAIHVGFPRHRPFGQPLEDVFHHVTWPKLLAFGVAGWCLHADEINNLALRHNAKLKGLRLRDVFLKGNSRWKHVLTTLRSEMKVLEWISLRRIGYDQPDEIFLNGGGAEVPDELDLDSDSTDESETQTDDEHTNDVAGVGPSNLHHTNGHSHADDDWEERRASDDEDNGPEANETDFPRNVLNQDQSNGKLMTNGTNKKIVEPEVDLEDDGESVTRQQRKSWEAFVVRRSTSEGKVGLSL